MDGFLSLYYGSDYIIEQEENVKSRPVILFDSFSNWKSSRSFGVFVCVCVSCVIGCSWALHSTGEATRMNQAPWCITWFKIRSRQSSAPFARLPITTQYRTHPSHLPLLRRSNYENRNPDVFLGSLLFHLDGLFPSFLFGFGFASITALSFSIQWSGLKYKKKELLVWMLRYFAARLQASNRHTLRRRRGVSRDWTKVERLYFYFLVLFH